MTAESKKPSKLGCGPIIIMFVIGMVIVSYITNENKTPEQIAKDEQENAEKHRKGFHCLSAWDGSSSNFERILKERLREPSSYEHIETRIAPINSEGMHKIYVKYRARNGFGGMNVGEAVGELRNSDCSAAILYVE